MNEPTRSIAPMIKHPNGASNLSWSHKKLGGADLLRAFAAWAVVAWHLSDRLNYKLPIFNSAAWAVDLFMNASGFLMLYHYIWRESIEPWRSPRTWSCFYIRRWFRIAPLYGFLVLCVAFFPPMQPFLPLEGIAARSLYVIERLTFVFGFIPNRISFGPFPDWSLALEVQFYLCFPFLALLIRKVGAGFFFFLACVVAATANALISYYGPDTHHSFLHLSQPTLLPLKLHIFAVGMISAEVFVSGAKALKSLWFIAAIPFYALASPNNYSQFLGVVYLYIGLFVAFSNAINPLLHNSGRNLVGRLDDLGNYPLISYLAEGSYSVYLTHGFLVCFVSASSSVTSTAIGTIHFLAVFFLCFSILNICSFALFSSIERPATKVGKQIVTVLHPTPA